MGIEVGLCVGRVLGENDGDSDGNCEGLAVGHGIVALAKPTFKDPFTKKQKNITSE